MEKSSRRKQVLRMLAGVLCLIMAFGMLPARAFADLSDSEKAALENKTAAELKRLMDGAKADLDKYTAQVKKDDQAVTNAMTLMNSARDKIQPQMS